MNMTLTPDQQAMLDGANGAALAKCLQTLVQYGEAFGAKRLVPIKSAHLTGSFKIFFYTAYYEIIQQLVADGVKVKVPTTLNPRPGYEYTPQNRLVFRGQQWHESQLEALGIIPNYSCVCYRHHNIPEQGDVLGWAESSAIIYANSVIGARTNRNSIMVDICQAVTGLTPEFGYLLDENRRGQVRIKLDVDKMDAAALGFLVGKIAVDRVPVLDHHPFTLDQLKNMGAAMASSGGVTLFHVIGVTPEAPDEATAFGGNEPEETVTVTQAMLDELRTEHAIAKDAKVVAFGCPQMTLEEVLELAPHFAGRKVKKRTLFHLIPAAYEQLEGRPEYQQLKDAGVELLQHCPLAGLSLRIGLGRKEVLTPSGKLYYYLEGTRYGNLEDVLAICGVMEEAA
ncbi:aconitase X catalytic domain-containing protein [Ferrimonas marina]|uniref:Predicted aconitase subunit 1 n=1 Tax=Ferrimonas marina TaxID=299255 RepID=A0A1M5MN75_9GAMM|nr:aconitase X catalytic domain-containing protein [Ferrimonas marina]SHG78637.1 predicted aconitase subunit 1 [Ferrimonas marina]